MSAPTTEEQYWINAQDLMEAGEPVPDYITEVIGDPNDDLALYGDVRAWLDGDMRPVEPDLMRRDDGAHLFYRGHMNVLIGDPESGKTWVALAACARELIDGGRVLYVDADHNGMSGIIPRLLILGAPRSAVVDKASFRYIEVDDSDTYQKVAHAASNVWRPTLAVIDCHAAVASMHGLNDNDSGDMRTYARDCIYPFTRGGGAVILIDHMAKNENSRSLGATGSMAKSAAMNGVAYRIDVKDAWSRSVGGASNLSIVKDRPGGVRDVCPQPENGHRPFAGIFRLHPPKDDGTTEQAWAVYAPGRDGEPPEVSDMVARIDALSPEQRTGGVRSVRDALGGRNAVVSEAWKIWKSQHPTEDPGNSHRAPVTQDLP